MKVTIRTKALSNNRQSIYLDFYPPIENPNTRALTRREFLNLYLYDNAKTPIDKKHNKETLLLASNIRAQRQLAIQADDYGFLKSDRSNDDFLAYFNKLAEEHKKTAKGDRNNWLSVLKYLKRFTNDNCKVRHINETFCADFKNYLQQSTTFVENKDKLANNSAVGYFNIFKRVIKQAHKEKLLEEDFALHIKAIKKLQTQREFLSLDELQQLANTPCDLPILKNAAIFAAYTGLRYSDIEKLTWGEIHGNKKDGFSIRFTQKKTRSIETLPFSEDAFKLLGIPGNSETKVFKQLLYSAWQNQKLQDWAYRAGIYRKITFHTFRHTFATLQLSLGTDIYTVSKMLGHKDLHTTQIYAKIIDQTKRDAANKIKLDL